MTLLRRQNNEQLCLPIEPFKAPIPRAMPACSRGILDN